MAKSRKEQITLSDEQRAFHWSKKPEDIIAS